MMRGDRLRSLRMESGDTQKDLAEVASVTEATVANYENARSEPEALPLLRLAAHFGVSSEYLMGITDDPARQTNVPPEWEHMVNRAIQNKYEPDEVEKAFAVIAAIRAVENAQGRKA